GKNPALRISADIMFDIVPVDKSPRFYPPNNHTGVYWGTVFPNEERTYPITPTPNNPDGTARRISTVELNDLVNGRAYVAVHGQVRYRDPFGDHWTQFCHWRPFTQVNIPPRGPAACVNYNSVGDGKAPDYSWQKTQKQ